MPAFSGSDGDFRLPLNCSIINHSVILFANVIGPEKQKIKLKWCLVHGNAQFAFMNALLIHVEGCSDVE